MSINPDPPPDLHRFLFDRLPVRGALVQLRQSWRETLAVRAATGAYAEPVQHLLGEMIAAGVLMQSNIKFDGALVLQLVGDDPVNLAIAEIQSDLRFRATAQVREPVARGIGFAELVNRSGGGRCAMMLDANDRADGAAPYQGIVPLHDDNGAPLHALAEVVEHYMLQSEQVDTRLVLAANSECAAGLLIQRVAATRAGEHHEQPIGENEDFNRIAHLAASVTAQELLSLDADTVLRRLFWEESLIRFEVQQPQFHCNCDRQRVSRVLLTLGETDLNDLLAERGQVEVDCDYCGAQYVYDAIDVAELFVPESSQGGTTDSVH